MDATADQRARFGAELRRLRADELGLSARAVADRLADELGEPVTHQSVTGWERGEFAPRQRRVVEALERVLEANGVLLPLLGYDPSDAGVFERLAAIEGRQERIEEMFDLMRDELRRIREATEGLGDR